MQNLVFAVENLALLIKFANKKTVEKLQHFKFYNSDRN